MNIVQEVSKNRNIPIEKRIATKKDALDWLYDNWESARATVRIWFDQQDEILELRMAREQAESGEELWFRSLRDNNVWNRAKQRQSVHRPGYKG